MTNVINLQDIMRDPAVEKIQAEIKDYEKDILDLTAERDAAIEREDNARNNGDKEAEKDAAEDLKFTKRKLSRLTEKLNEARGEYDKIKEEAIALLKEESSQENVVKAFENLNAYFITTERKWYCVYTDGVRHQPIQKELDDITMRDVIFGETGWDEGNDKKIKAMARNDNRMFRDAERSWNPRKPHTLNQMSALRKFWLEPIYGKEPHWGLQVLFNSIAGGNKDYADQLWKIVAMKHQKPERFIDIPNIDSAARGGTGRDTFFLILRRIFTELCVVEVNGEALGGGTHNGELDGAVWVIVSDRDLRTMSNEVIKNLTGGLTFRLRKMQKNATTAYRCFNIFGATNEGQGNFKLTGVKGGAEDRRYEQMIALKNLEYRVAEYWGFQDEYESDDDEIRTAAKVRANDMITELHETVFSNDTLLAEALGWAIEKFDIKNTTKIRPLYGDYYDMMYKRQKNNFEHFMDTLMDIKDTTNVYDKDELFKIYNITAVSKIGKDKFIHQVLDWLRTRSGMEWILSSKDFYEDQNNTYEQRKRRQIFHPVFGKGLETEEQQFGKFVWNKFEFLIDEGFNLQDEHGNDISGTIHSHSIRREFF